ncbi:Gfo/Idh/MocA family protein [Deinococcus planocerae]|uniref:Gfo/Idh/MocA family protein n=1 Tax=Deinococcus planocerae TaxID=1737569 RepID=UPI000C7F6601|nr:Gfo/Idh/MocA family oxidoreductase [Deinococcus planocerae]
MADSPRAALIGCGFFARNHAHAWRDLGVDLAAVCDTDAGKARAFAETFGGTPYSDVETLLRSERLDFVDVATGAASHRALVETAARHGLPVICQKPLALNLEDARAMVGACREAGVAFMVHENFRWQTPMRAAKAASERLGRLHFGRIVYRTPYDVYRDQPYLLTDERFVLTDVGVHALDLARFFLGEVAWVAAHTGRVHPRVRGEDTATVLLGLASGGSGVVELSYGAKTERDLFPQTLVYLEGERGTVTLGADYEVTVVLDEREGFHSGLEQVSVERLRAAPPPRPWTAPPLDVVQDSVLNIQRHWLDCLREGRAPETSGEDNLGTLEAVFAAYDAAERGTVVHLAPRPEEARA